MIEEWSELWCKIRNIKETGFSCEQIEDCEPFLEWLGVVKVFSTSLFVGKFKPLLRRPCAWYCSCLSDDWYFEVGVLEYCSPVLGSTAECHLQLLERQVYSMATFYPDRGFLSICHRPHVAGLSMLFKVRTLITIIIIHLL